MNMTFPAKFLAVLLTALLWLAAPDCFAASRSRKSDPVLILHDATGPFGWIGGVHARMLANLLGHFDVPYRAVPVDAYVPGSVEQAQAIFYLGTTYDQPLPPAFRQEVLATSRPVCWFKYNLWQLNAGPGSAFAAKYGFQFDFLDPSGYELVSYKQETFGKDQADRELGHTTLVSGGAASVPAWACRQGSAECIPYVVHGGNFWYVADTPFSFISEEDRYLVFCDLLHDILGMDHAEQHRALIRIEDVDARTSPDSIRAVTDYLNGRGLPFLLSVIPVHQDPLGFYTGGVPRTVPLSQAGPLREALREAVGRGGQIVAHGYTHQWDVSPNPYTGASGDDFEFMRVQLDAARAFVEFEAVPGDSYKWAQGRARAAVREFRKAGFSVTAWSTPHYAASAIDFAAFGDLFPLTVQRVIYFEDTGNVTGVQGRGQRWRALFASGGHFGGQFFPYVIQEDIYGQKVVPENLGNVDLPVLNGSAVRRPADMIRIAHKNRVIRDGWASGFFHPFLDLALLRELVEGIQAEGYTFVPLAPSVR
jgi:uncharacterized protein YdaL